MVIETFRDVLTLLPIIFAGLAALTGIFVLEGFFRNKLKELFSDINYFIFFFLVSGYFLYALGEVSFYVAKTIFQDKSLIGIEDFYWSAGSILILISFLALTLLLLKQYGGGAKLTMIVVIGGVLVAFVLYLLTSVTLRGADSFFGYFYPLASSLIVTFSLSVILYSRQLEQLYLPLMMFFLASCGILLGDVFFTYTTTQGIYLTSSLGSLADAFYSAGYGLSLIAFITMRVRMQSLALKR